MEWTVQTTLALFFLLIFSVVILRMLQKPLAASATILFRVGCAAIGLVAFNFVAGFFSYSLPINLVTVGGVSLLGLPGLGLVLAVRHFLL